MVRRCCVPNCTSNKTSTIKTEGYVSVFRFPKDEERKLLWIKSIGRENFVLKSHGVCAKHFDEEDIIRHDPYLRKDGTLTYLLLRVARLKDTAYPKIFPNSLDQSQKRRIQSKSTQNIIASRKHSGVEVATTLANLNTKVSSTNSCNEGKIENNEVKMEYLKEFVDDNEIHNCTILEEENGQLLAAWNEKADGTISIESKFHQNIEINPEIVPYFKQEEEILDEVDIIKKEHLEEFIGNNELYNGITFNKENEKEYDATSIHNKFHQIIDQNEPEIPTNFKQESTTIKIDTKKHNKDFNLETKEHKCQLCDYFSISEKQLKQHMDKVHFRSKPHQCEYCDFSTDNKSYLRTHKDAVHLGLKPYRCEYCDFRAITNAKVKKHTNAVHLKWKPHKCDKCDFSACEKGVLTQHINSVHLKLKQFKCDKCSFTTTWWRYLRQHLKGGHLIKYKCTLCDHVGTCDEDLKKHIDVVHFNKKLYRCNFCKYSDLQEKNLKIHMNFFHPTK